MDPNDILALVAGGGGGLIVLGAGAWAYVRSRGKKSSDQQDTPPAKDGQGTTGTSTAVKERPAAPTWADTLSAPAPPKRSEQDAEADETVQGGAEAPTAVPDADAEPAPEQTTAEDTSAASPAAPGDAPAEAVTVPPAETVTAPTAETAPESAPAAGEASADTAPGDTAPSGGAPVDTASTADAGADAEPAGTAVAGETATESAPALIETPEAPADRMVRLRERLSRSGSIGRGILNLLTRGTVDEDTWDEIEETLLLADLGPDATDELLESLRRRIQILGTDDPAAVREVLREELVGLVNPELDRRLAATRRTAPDDTEVPSVILMVGVNGTGKTTTVGKLARVLVAAERTVVLGAADTFRAAAADQLATWGSRVGVDTVRSDRDGADPAAVAFDAVKEGIAQQVDVVIIDTAGRLQNKKGLMDELGKVRRVAEKGLHGDQVAEVLLVIDATTGQNGMQQARVFSEAVNITGIVLTKLDGTAKGGIVINVQRELGVPVKMVGLGEGMDDLTPFDPHGFVDALLEG